MPPPRTPLIMRSAFLCGRPFFRLLRRACGAPERDLRPKGVPRIRVAENNLDGIGRPLRAPGSQHANAEELLAELVRLVESSRLAPERSSARVETVSLHPLVEAPSSKPRETRVVDVEPPRAPESDNSYSNDPNGIDLAAGRRSGAWTFRVPALVLAGAAVIGSIFWLERIEPRLPEAAPFVATAEGPTIVQPRSNLTVATSSDAGVTPLRDITQPAEGCQSRRAANRPERSRLAQESAASRLGADRYRRGAADGRAHWKAIRGVGQFARRSGADRGLSAYGVAIS